jgi:two-component system CitB family sensor kinase
MDTATRPQRSWRLSTQVLVLQLLIITLTVGAGFAVSFLQARRQLDGRAGEESLAIAETVASTPAIVAAFGTPYPAAVIDPIVEDIRARTGAAFIVVADRDGIRYSHPNPAKIGTSLLADKGESPASVLAGHTYVGVQSGSLGRSMRAKVPIRDRAGQVIGLVSVGVLENSVGSRLVAALPVTLIPPGLGLLLGAVGAFLLARRVKRQTFGLEPNEIGALLEQREAMLHGIREGAITVDSAGRLTLLNDEAQRLLGVDRAALGRPLAEVLPRGRVRDVLTGRTDGLDEIVLVNDRVLVVNRMPVALHGRPIGAVVTLRDRTELETLVRERDDLRSLADALRAQEHEFANRLHVLGGLIELQRYEDAIAFINVNSQLHQDLAGALVERVGDPLISGLLLGKASVASERGISLRIAADLEAGAADDPGGLVTVIGNLIDNAMESVPYGGRVDVRVRADADDVVITVHDSGPGIDPGLLSEVFRDGFTTKPTRDGTRRRGLGLALVSQEVRRRDGEIRVENADGALFTVVVPRRVPAGAGTVPS